MLHTLDGGDPQKTTWVKRTIAYRDLPDGFVQFKVAGDAAHNSHPASDSPPVTVTFTSERRHSASTTPTHVADQPESHSLHGLHAGTDADDEESPDKPANPADITTRINAVISEMQSLRQSLVGTCRSGLRPADDHAVFIV